jgi:hypothetical protein
MHRFTAISLASAGFAALLALSTTAQAENAKGFLDVSPTNKQTFTRYPDDKGYQFGTTQRAADGSEQPYVEKCFWTAENGFFGGFTQTCQRYTLENTQ